MIADSRASAQERSMNDGGIDIYQRIGMWLRKVPIRRILRAHRLLREAGIGNVLTVHLETQYLAGGDPELCAQAMVEASRKRSNATWDSITAFDLTGGDPLAAVSGNADFTRLVGGPEYKGRFQKHALSRQ
jgi:uncharacterized protein YqfA (UPF0365 family)